MNRNLCFGSIRRTLSLSGALVGCLALGFQATTLSAPALAQRVQQRTVDGTVTSGGAPVKGAVVHLKDTRTLAQKSYITAADGTYRFAQLSSTADYEVWADSDGKKSSIKSISSFDTKPAFTIDLKMD